MRRYLPFLLGLFALAALLRVEFFFTIAYLFFAVYVLARLWMRAAPAGLRVTRRFSPRAFCGEQVTVDLELHNGGRLPIPWVQVHESLPVDLISPPRAQAVASLAPGERRRLRYTLDCRKRGYYALGPLRARSGDLLGLVDPPPWEVAAEHLTVFPRVVALQRLGLPARAPLAALAARTPLFEDPARVAGVRDYRRGDSPRRIHWTATASAGRLLVKQYQPAIARETLVVLDFDENNYTPQQRYEAGELGVVVAASLIHHIAMRERLPAGLLVEGFDPRAGERVRRLLRPRRERAHVTLLLDTLACIQLAPGTPVATLLDEARVQLAWGTTLAIVTPRPDAALFATLARLRRGGFAVALVLVQPGQLPANLRAQAGLLGVPVRRVWDEHDLEARL
jgi:uncharacterized protein (DUF58 family)